MKKQVALAVAAALSLSVAGTTLAAPANPFVDVPANHWAYDAVAQLQQTGIVGGYGDGTFRGDRTLTRYELAAIVAKINPELGADNPLVKKLQAEFATELYNLGVRVDALEKNASSIKFSGDARIRYQWAPGLNDDNGSDDAERYQQRVRLYTDAQVNDNIVFKGRIEYVNTNLNRADGNNQGRTDGSTEMAFDRAYFLWNNANTSVALGRIEGGYGGINTIGQGLIWGGGTSDGVLVAYNNGKFNAALGELDLIGDTSYTNLKPDNKISGDDSIAVTVAELGYTFSDRVNASIGYSNASSYDVQQWSIGANAKLGQNVNLIAEYLTNEDADDSHEAGWVRLAYGQAKMSEVGSFNVYAEYLKFGKNSLVGAGGNGMDQFDPTGIFDTGDGTKGWGLGGTYVVGKNHNVQLFWHKLKPMSGGQDFKDQITLATNFAF